MTEGIKLKAKILALYLFGLLFLALYSNLGNHLFNQIILWVFGPLLTVYIILPKIRQLSIIRIEYWLYFSLLIFSILGFYKVTDTTGFLRYLQVILANFVLMIIIYFTINTEREWFLIWKIIWIAGIVVTLFSLFYETPELDSDQRFRLAGITGNANGTANYARVAIMASLLLLNSYQQRTIRIILNVSVIYLSFIVLITASRGTFFNLIFILGGYLTMKYLKGWKALAAIIVVLIFGTFMFSQFEKFIDDFYIYQRMTRFDTFNEIIEGETRIKLYKQAWSTFMQYPILGVGLGQFPLYADGKMTHTDILDILVQLGIFAGLIYIALYYKVLRGILRMKEYLYGLKERALHIILIICFCSEIIYGLTNPNWFSQLQMIVLSLFIVFYSKGLFIYDN
jgi:O-antigen ligase